MSEPLKLAIVGVGRMGAIHALHAFELSRETGSCEVVALVDSDVERVRRYASQLGGDVPVLASIEELIAARICNASVVVTPTDCHRENASMLIAAGHRVLMEKPLTGDLQTDREFAAELDRNNPQALMLAFQRRFDAPLQYARTLMESGVIGRVFKIYSSLEDSNPAPDGYNSGGILPDMSIHNVDEVLWLTGQMPQAALAIGSNIYSHALTTCKEDFDDALLCLWFDGIMAQIQVTRNHVSGYRVETILFGSEGQIHVGRFEQKPLEILVEAYGRRGREEPLDRRAFTMRQYPGSLPEFADRFGPAYKAELSAFVDCCRAGAPFPTTHNDALQAQRVISAGMQSVITRRHAAAV
ncbi:MAG TPA: Gfo/Idh/MocA family oxidoreductase [Bryobacteraceae bacterium]|jgi:myo-inositol 2-dehydrogenase/D-chiro-inositol 1-dehydrogenase|nr:Gfo/Idh/MocA family oxidoreductase [Bryobacteraceae bacterium]